MNDDGARGDRPGGRPGADHDADVEREAARKLTSYLALTAALVLHVMVGALLPLTTALGPRWMLAASVLAWVAAAMLIWRWHRLRPIATMLVPFAVLGAWYLALQIGSAVLGWGD